MKELIEQFDNILPLAVEWAKSQEAMILQNGQPLSTQLVSDAIKLGVKHPENVRILKVSTIPIPEHPILRAACNETQLISPNTGGLTLRYGIFMRSDCARDRKLCVHELAHVVQYEKLGGISQFLKQYLFEVATIGYPQAPMEQEAIQSENINLT